MSAELTYWTEVLAEETGVPFREVGRVEGAKLALRLVHEDGRSVTLPIVDLLSRREFERACLKGLGVLPTKRVRPSRWRDIVAELTTAVEA